MQHDTIKRAGWLATAALVGGALFAPAATLAQTGNQTDVSSASATQGCTGGPGGSDITPGTGEVAWLFVHAGVAGPGTLTAHFATAGTQTAGSYVQGGVKYLVVTAGPDTLQDFSDTIAEGVLTLSHVCYGSQPTPTPYVPTPTPYVPTPTPELPTATPDLPTATPDLPTATPDLPTATPDLPTATPDLPTSTPEPVVTPTPQVPTATPAPTGTVEAFTGTPRVTPPSTDTMGNGGPSSSGPGLALVMLVLGSLALGASMLRPASKRIRR